MEHTPGQWKEQRPRRTQVVYWHERGNLAADGKIHKARRSVPPPSPPFWLSVMEHIRTPKVMLTTQTSLRQWLGSFCLSSLFLRSWCALSLTLFFQWHANVRLIPVLSSSSPSIAQTHLPVTPHSVVRVRGSPSCWLLSVGHSLQERIIGRHSKIGEWCAISMSPSVTTRFNHLLPVHYLLRQQSFSVSTGSWHCVSDNGGAKTHLAHLRALRCSCFLNDFITYVVMEYTPDTLPLHICPSMT